jgi:hypothetical protein
MNYEDLLFTELSPLPAPKPLVPEAAQSPERKNNEDSDE